MNIQLPKSLGHLLYDAAKGKEDKPLYHEKKDGVYQSYSYKEIIHKVRSLAKAMIQDGLKDNDKVAIFSQNNLNWAITDYAALSASLVDVPIYPTLLSSTVEFILNNSESKIIFVENLELLKKLFEIPADKLKVKKIIVMSNESHEDSRVVPFDDYLKSGETNDDEEFNKRLEAIDLKQLATIIYTSGTTGIPKGVMLSHENILFNVENSIKVLPFKLSDDEKFLSFLPLSHIFERMAGHFMAMRVGAQIAFAEGIETVAQNMQEVSPTIMASVPRLYEKMYAKVIESVENSAAIRQTIFYWAVNVGKEVVNNYTKHGKKPSGLLAFKLAIANKLVFSKLCDKVGGKLRFFVSGGGALLAEIAEFFSAAGLLILEGYGLTETSPVITVNHPDKFKFGYVGPPIEGVEVKIAEDGEILTRSRSVMMGYYKNDNASKEAIDAEGWFYTGDIGALDEDNFLKITDRKKDILVTSGGKNVAPLPIESSLLLSKYIDQAVVIGDKERFIAAILVASKEAIGEYAKKQNISGSIEELVNNDKIRQLIDLDIERVNSKLASYETIKKYILLSKPFTIESGELTPKLSVKKKEVLKNQATAIKELYAS
jgi:long-chain acyl-CoA synthetase